MSSTTAAASGALAGAWFGELASALQGSWQAVCEHRPRQHPELVSGGRSLVENNNKKAAGAAAGAGNRPATKKKDVEYVGACGGAISDATLCLLLDRFAPS